MRQRPSEMLQSSFWVGRHMCASPVVSRRWLWCPPSLYLLQSSFLLFPPTPWALAGSSLMETFCTGWGFQGLPFFAHCLAILVAICCPRKPLWGCQSKAWILFFCGDEDSQGSISPRLVLNLQYNQGCPWTSVPPICASGMLGEWACVTMPHVHFI